MALLRLVARQNMIDTPLAITLFAVSLLFIITATLSVILRLWAKRINKGKIIIEDHLCITSLILVIIQFICLVLR